ncbi:MAG: NLP/P60-like protein [Firmicutes bacterium]|nr:NLP/P60-like protein [Bacillota bacterium]
MQFYRQKKSIFVLIILCIIWLAPFPRAHCSAPVTDFGMTKPGYWIAKLPTPDAIVMSEKQIQGYNRAIQKAIPETVVDLQRYPRVLDKKTLTRYVTTAVLPKETVYQNDNSAGAEFYNDLRMKINLPGIKESNPVQYGYTVKRADMRTFPTAEGVFAAPGDREFDLFQETAVDPAAPVLVLHRSLRNDWLFVQTGNYRGWLPTEAVAIAATQKQWLDYMNLSRYLVVTGCRLQIPGNSSGDRPLTFEMGAKLPLAQINGSETIKTGYSVLLPVRNQDGKAAFCNFSVPDHADVHMGYLPYTTANVIRQAFKFYGQPYGWGGLHNDVDCSSLVMDVYRSFGVLLPRNADQQEVAVGKILRFKTTDYASRAKELLWLQPGATLHMDGHVMLYLGKDKDRYYIIHSLASYGDDRQANGDGTLGRAEAMKVVVSDLDLPRRNGKTFLEALTVGKNIVL